MDSGYEPLPPRTGGRAAKRRRHEEPESYSAEKSAETALKSAASSEDSGKETDFTTVATGDYAENLQYEYLDHTADVQIHSWGDNLGDAIVQNALGMFGYMTEPDTVRIDPSLNRTVDGEGHDLVSLMFNFLDNCLFQFATDDFLIKDMKVLSLTTPSDADPTAEKKESTTPKYRIQALCLGEKFVYGQHPQGTEIKAITYSNMQIITPHATYTANDAEKKETVSEVAGVGGVDATAAPAGRRGAYDIYVIVDI